MFNLPNEGGPAIVRSGHACWAWMPWCCFFWKLSSDPRDGGLTGLVTGAESDATEKLQWANFSVIRWGIQILSFNEIYLVFCLFKIYILNSRSKTVSAGIYRVFLDLGQLSAAPWTILKTKVFIMEGIRKSVAGPWPLSRRPEPC